MTILFEKSQQLQSLEPIINQNNDLYEGRRKFIENMNLYYDGLELDTPEKKLARWKRTPFYFYYPKIISSFNSSIFKKPPHYELPLPDDDELMINVDLLGNSVNEFSAQIPLQVLKQGFCATINDYSEVLARPYLTLIKPEQFVTIQISSEKGYPELSQFVYEVMEEKPNEENEFKIDLTKTFYVWSLDTNKETSKKQVRVRKYARETVQVNVTNYLKKKDQSLYADVLKEENWITKNGKPLDKLPVTIHGKESNNYTVDRSVLQDLSDLNINLINRVVDQVEVLHYTALPTPWISGVDPDDPDTPTTIGSAKLWVLSEPESKVGMLEFDGKSAQAHRDYINDLKEVMAVTGAQILKQQGVSRETATSVLIRSGQETAVITSIVLNISSQLQEVYTTYFDWAKEDISNIVYKLNSDFLSVDMEPNAQIALVRSWIDGAISHKTVFEKMKAGEIIQANKTFEEEMEDIKEYPPSFFEKEKDAEIAEEAAAEAAKVAESIAAKTAGPGTGGDQESGLNGSNLETGNEVKNTEIKN